ncbi:MAG: glycosyl hydrolase family 28-related protein [Cytophagaceae bacterium]
MKNRKLIRKALIIAGLFLCLLIKIKAEKIGAEINWTNYEAENTKTNGVVLGPKYDPFLVETESSGQKCVKLEGPGKFIEFKVSKKANAAVIRYSLPDSDDGKGTGLSLAIYKNGKLIKTVAISSRYSRLYGYYPFSNDPKEGRPRNYYDEVRLKDFEVKEGDILKIRCEIKPGDNASYCIIDLIDLELIPEPIKVPENSLSINDKEFTGEDFKGDYTEAFQKCIGKAWESGKVVWIPAGTFKISGNIFVPSNVKIMGAGMWHSVLEGDEELYEEPGNRVRIIGNGSNIQLADFAIVGKLNYRKDDEWNDGIVGSFGENSGISRLWIEHTKIGVWVENSRNLVVEGCRFRNLIADGINFCVGMTESTMRNCTARGTGDDCFAMWPATFLFQKYTPGKNVIENCTGQLPFLANGAAIYGGESNKIINCSFTDISPGSAILISTTFPTEDKKVNNNFTGTTVIENCEIKTSGGYDHTWEWRAAIQICLDKRNISGLAIRNVNILNSFSDGISIIGRSYKNNIPQLSDAIFENVNVSGYGLGSKGKYGLWIDQGAQGKIALLNSNIVEKKNESSGFALTMQ